MEYNVNPDTKIPLTIVILLAALGLALGLTPTFYTGLPSYVFLLPSMVVFIVCLLMLSRFVMTTYTYQLYDGANTMSKYPKLNIYRIRKASSRMVYCIPFNNIRYIKNFEKIPKSRIPRENLCASLHPRGIYCVRYLCDDHDEEVYLECDETFAKEIANRIKIWSEVGEDSQ